MTFTSKLQIHVCLTRVSMVAVQFIKEPIVVYVLMEPQGETVIRVSSVCLIRILCPCKEDLLRPTFI